MKVNFDFNLTDSYGEELEQIKMVARPPIVVNDVLIDKKPLIVDNKIIMEPINAIPLITASIINPAFVTGDYIKHVELSDRVKKEKELDIDKADFDLIKKSIDFKSNGLPPKVKGYILLKFREIDINNALPIPQKSESEAKKETKTKTEEKK